MATPTEVATRLATNPAVARWSSIWERVPLRARTNVVKFLIRSVVVLAFVLIAQHIVADAGYVTALKHTAQLPRVDVKVPFTPLETTLTPDAMVFWLIFTLSAGAAFSPWRSTAALFGVSWLIAVAVGIQYMRITASALPAALSQFLFNILPTTPRDPNLWMVFETLGLFLVACLYGAIEGGRAVRQAYEEKGAVRVSLRSFAILQTGAIVAVALGAFAGAAILAILLLWLAPVFRGGSFPYVNPVLAFVVMGISLALLILTFAWKPDPNQRDVGALAALKGSLLGSKKDNDHEKAKGKEKGKEKPAARVENDRKA
jgi:hypothetical protein